ncbi:hypothetical protein K7432_000202 [Basidiobolus ranarum]|uniref:polynucleotide adenylyltransferase n=1 Tax=Basidiobolus ranarum TaxID=34480 RepID=A0ABR2WBI2_9FUNG
MPTTTMSCLPTQNHFPQKSCSKQKLERNFGRGNTQSPDRSLSSTSLLSSSIPSPSLPQSHKQAFPHNSPTISSDVATENLKPVDCVQHSESSESQGHITPHSVPASPNHPVQDSQPSHFYPWGVQGFSGSPIPPPQNWGLLPPHYPANGSPVPMMSMMWTKVDANDSKGSPTFANGHIPTSPSYATQGSNQNSPSQPPQVAPIMYYPIPFGWNTGGQPPEWPHYGGYMPYPPVPILIGPNGYPVSMVPPPSEGFGWPAPGTNLESSRQSPMSNHRQPENLEQASNEKVKHPPSTTEETNSASHPQEKAETINQSRVNDIPQETERMMADFNDLSVSHHTKGTDQVSQEPQHPSAEDPQKHTRSYQPRSENGHHQGNRYNKKTFHRGNTFGEQAKPERSYTNRTNQPSRGAGQYEGKRVLDKTDPRYLKARSRFLSILTDHASELFLQLTPSVEEVSRREQLYFRIHSICEELFPDAQLFQFGSTANGFGLKNADVDFCLCTAENSSLTAVAFVEKLGSVLIERGMENVMLLTRTRIPIIKLKDPISSLNCDIGFNNRLAVYNTRLLRMYAEVDPRVKQIVAVVKHWAKSRQINEPYLGTLSSYAYVLMIIFVLQQRGVLPCLQEIYEGEKKEVMVDGYDAYFFDNITDLPKHWQSQNNETLGELLYEFFRYYASDFSYYGSVLSVRTGQVINKEEKGWTSEATRESGPSAHVQDRYWVCIEDPFEITHNLGRPVSKNSLYTIRGEFMRAANILGGTRTSTILERLCQVYIPEEEPPRGPPGVHERTN